MSIAPLPAAPTPVTHGPLAVTRLTLTGFRSYSALRLDTAPLPQVLVGPNGAGKTNLLEALSMLAPGRGLRRARLTDIARRPPKGQSPNGQLPEGQSSMGRLPEGGAVDPIGTACAAGAVAGPAHAGWAVAATLQTQAGPVEIGTGLDLVPGGTGDPRARRVVRIDGAGAPGPAALGAHMRLLWLTPEMDRLFDNAASGRRRFLDRLVIGFDADHAGRLRRYEHALRERARLLRGAADPAWLGVLESTMAETGIAIAAARRDLARRLDAALGAADSGAFPRARLALKGEAENALDTMPALAAEDLLRAKLAGSRQLDREVGGAAAGPHRTDLAVTHAGKSMPAGDCSTGEQKALLIGIVLGAARLQAEIFGAPPLLLLDEIGAHLDRTRRDALFDAVCALGAQAWMTGTEPDAFRALVGRACFLAVQDAAIRPAPIGGALDG